LEENLRTDKQLMKKIKLLQDSKYKEKMDRETWHLIRSIRDAIHSNDSTSRKEVQEILNKMDNLFPTMIKNVLKLMDDDHFLATYNYEFTMYFPESIADYIYKELNTYYNENDYIE
jgi:hypothetical protein